MILTPEPFAMEPGFMLKHMRIVLMLCGFVSCIVLAGCGSSEPTKYVYIVQEGAPNNGAPQASAAGVNATPLALNIMGSPAKGPADAKVTIIESSDFQ